MHKKVEFEVLNSFVFVVLILTLGLGPLVPIKTYSQLSYRLPDQQQSSEKQQNQDKIIITMNLTILCHRSQATIIISL